MASFKFFNIPQTGGGDAYEDSGRPDELKIVYSINNFPSERGWVSGKPQQVFCVIERPFHTEVADAQDDQADDSPAGDLPLLRVALASTDPGWVTDRESKGSWPGVDLELDNQAGVQIKMRLERLIVDSWSLQTSTNGGPHTESIVLRGFVATHANSAGEAQTLSLTESHS